MKEHVCFLIIKETVDRIQALFLQALKKLAGGKENGLGLLGDKTSFNFLGCVAGGFYLFIYLFQRVLKIPNSHMLQAEGRARGHLSLCCCSCVLEKEDILLALETAWEHRGLERLFSEPVQSWQPVGLLGSLLQVSLGQTLGTGHTVVWASLLRKGKTESPGPGPRWGPDLLPNRERGWG